MTRTMLITGASSGIGQATAQAALAAGWRVGLFARRADKLEEVAAAGDALVLPGDVTQVEDVDAAVEKLADTFGRLDVLFNNAGVFPPPGPIDELSVDEWRRAVDVNLNGMFYAARAAFRLMRAQDPQGGRIVNNGSISAYVPREGSVGYTTTKHAITGLTRTLSLDGREFNIACGQIDIGNARTPMVADLSKRHVGAGKEPPHTMDVNEAVRSILLMADMPLEANVQFMTVMATKMPYIGRG